MASLEELQGVRYRELENKLDIDPARVRELSRISALSDYFHAYLNTRAALSLISSGDLFRRYDGTEIRQSLEDIDIDSFDESLRRIRAREMARIIFRDLSRRADLIETTRDLSNLADNCIQAALDFHYSQNVAKYGTPRGRSGAEQQMCVLALGKLGGVELNVSSDIDLVFLYGEAGQADGQGVINNQEFFIRLSRQIIGSLDTVTAAGFVFRVDMRLRPYGESGSLILNRNAMEKYFVEQGRDWERYAFIKARAAAGNLVLGRDFLAWLRPFVYRKYLDYGAIESLREMKQLINREVTKKDMKDDLKLGSGGIREVEFIVQSQQLIWGGNKPVLQERRLLIALDQLEQGEYLPGQDASLLRQSYLFLRNSEHAIQAEKDRQSQRLPDDELGQQRLADAMGFDTYQDYLSRLIEHRDQVAACFSKITGAPGLLADASSRWLSVWLDPQASDSIAFLNDRGFGDGTAVAALLAEFKSDGGELQEIGENRLERIMPILIWLCALEESPSITLQRLLPVVNSIKRRSTYLVFLRENMDAAKRLVLLCAMSPWVAKRVSDHPVLMYELTDRRSGEEQMDRESMKKDLEEVLRQIDDGDLEGHMDALRQYKNAAVLRVAVFELLNLLPTMAASDNLTMIAEVMLDKAIDLAFEHLVHRHGDPCDQQGHPQARCLAIVAYGKLGGIELAYGSDLDIVLLHDADIRGETNGARVIPNNVFFSRLGQRIVHILSSRTRFGLLYEIDLRLRPDGNKGPLVGTFNAYERYLLNDAWTWEHQALVRARFVGGDARFKKRFEVIRRSVLSLARDEGKLRLDVTNMRAKMREHASGATGRDLHKKAVDEVLLSGFDLKQGSGAIVDIEFLVQYLVLAHCHQHPELTYWTDKARLLEALAELNLFSVDDAKLLHEAYIAYRSVVHYTWLGGQIASQENLLAYRTRVIEIWNKQFAPRRVRED